MAKASEKKSSPSSLSSSSSSSSQATAQHPQSTPAVPKVGRPPDSSYHHNRYNYPVVERNNDAFMKVLAPYQDAASSVRFHTTEPSGTSKDIAQGGSSCCDNMNNNIELSTKETRLPVARESIDDDTMLSWLVGESESLLAGQWNNNSGPQ